ncbi:cytochrome b5 [Holotrichia oblita]|uniref:Cytochrome b5 n=2 Tax=Holotrichia oblita TaxID=644536 RepID=A0ACB9TCD7_HOLOL|nr:cytochrome b5 [Holotrichia oblita]KAI4464482.1 cytochrome b5 [Holotrichia oblita]
MSTATAIFTPSPHEFNYVNLVKSHENTDEHFSLEEIADHDNLMDCWVVIYDRVYDVTNFIKKHPGGADILLEYGGRDATIAFRGTGHSSFAVKALEKYYIGDLPVHQRLFRKQGGIVLSNMPA